MKTLMLCTALLFVGVLGCASRTKLVAGPFAVGGSSVAHRDPGLGISSTPSETCLTVGYVTVCGNWGITDCTKLFSLENVTGNRAKVEDSDVAKFD